VVPVVVGDEDRLDLIWFDIHQSQPFFQLPTTESLVYQYAMVLALDKRRITTTTRTEMRYR
jgi:hypothetical protein